MSDATVTDLLLTTLAAQGVPALGLTLLAGAFGLPIPVTLLVLAGGAFASQGVIDPALATVAAVAGAALGDCASYALGLLGRGPLERRLARRPTWQRAKDRFARRGWIAIVMSRVVMRPMALPVNLVAGSGGYPFLPFALFALLGEALWVVLYGGLGFTFATRWEAIAAFAGDLSGLLIGLVLAWFGGRHLWRRHTAGRDPEC